MQVDKSINPGFLIFGIVLFLHSIGVTFGLPSLLLVITNLALDVLVILFFYKGRLRFPKELMLWFLPVLVICFNTVDWKDLNSLKYLSWFIIGILTISICLKKRNDEIIFKIIIIIELILFFSLCVQLLTPGLFNSIIKPFIKNTDTYYYQFNIKHGIYYGIACDKTASNTIGMISIPIAFFTLGNRRDKWKKWLIVLSGAFLCAMSGSRTSLVLIPIILYFTYIICAADRKKIILTLRGAGIALVLIIIISVAGRLFPTIIALQRINTTIANLMGDSSIATVSSGRDLLYSTAINGIIKSPWMGHGWLQFNSSHIGIIDANTASYVHNLVLQLLYDVGIIGMIIFLIPFVYFYMYTLKTIRNQYRSGGIAVLEFKMSLYLQTILLTDSLLHVGILDSFLVQVYYLAIAFVLFGKIKMKQSRGVE